MPKTLKSYKDKEKAKLYRKTQKNKNYESGGFIDKLRINRHRWTESEDKILLYWTKTDRELAQLLKRPVRGIQQRRNALKYKT